MPTPTKHHIPTLQITIYAYPYQVPYTYPYKVPYMFTPICVYTYGICLDQQSTLNVYSIPSRPLRIGIYREDKENHGPTQRPDDPDEDGPIMYRDDDDETIEDEGENGGRGPILKKLISEEPPYTESLILLSLAQTVILD